MKDNSTKTDSHASLGGVGGRYSTKSTTSGTYSVFDSVRGVTILKSVTPQARYNQEVAERVCDLLNRGY